jgi:hypothetical protein
MNALYVIAVWVHILTVFAWIGALVFEDPKSVRLASRVSDKLGGLGWYAQGVLWTTGLMMLNHRGIRPAQLFSSQFIATDWGQAMWGKLTLVILLLVVQIAFGRPASKLVYGYLAALFLIVAISVMLARPIFFP